MPSNGTSIRSTKLRRLRALKMIEMRVMNKTYANIAAEFGISYNTVRRTLSWADKAGLIADAEDKILQDLVPAAHKAIQNALSDAEHKQEAGRLAIAIFQGVVPGFGKAKTSPHSSPDDPQPDDLTAYINQLRQDRPDALEGAVIQALPAATEAVSSEEPDAPAPTVGNDLHSPGGTEIVGQASHLGSE